MTRRKIITLLACASFMTAVLLTLWFKSSLSTPIEPSSFERQIDAIKTLVRMQVVNLDNGAYYIAGVAKTTTYVGNVNHPFEIIEISDTAEKQSHVVSLSGIDSIRNPRSFKTIVDSPSFIIHNGVMPAVLRGNTSTWQASKFLKDSGNYFVDLTPVSKHSLILRSLSTRSQMYQLARNTTLDTPFFNFEDGVLTKQKDGLIDVQGNLHFDTTTKRVLYLYAYRNEFIVLDTNLNVQARGTTIDTFKTAQLQITKVAKTGESIVSSPPTNVNAKSTTFDGQLFVQSNLLAKNELLQRFQESSSIDVYDIKTQRYLYTFYIPNYNNERLIDFRIKENSVIALYSHALVHFRLHLTKHQNGPATFENPTYASKILKQIVYKP